MQKLPYLTAYFHVLLFAFSDICYNADCFAMKCRHNFNSFVLVKISAKHRNFSYLYKENDNFKYPEVVASVQTIAAGGV